MKIYAAHLLNDYSGSPKVLMQLLKGWTQAGRDVVLITASGSEGFLSNIDDVKYLKYWYRWAKNPWIRLVTYIISQIHLLLRLLFLLKKQDVVYVNTVLPFGAAIAGKLVGCRVIYHVHETSIKPRMLKVFLFGIVKFTAKDIVYVSNYLAETEAIVGPGKHVLYNAIEGQFLNIARRIKSQPSRIPRNILMICSLKPYKGIEEYWSLACALPALRFRLVVNASVDEIVEFVNNRTIPPNLSIFPTQTNVHPSYRWADIVVNLSRPDQWIETFGLTIVEGMAYGLPAIVPPVGGIAELVKENITGFHVDSRNLELIKKRLTELCRPVVWAKMRKEVLSEVPNYSELIFWRKSLSIIDGTTAGRSFHVMESNVLKPLKIAQKHWV